MQKADHSGHRSRMKKKYIEYGASVFEPHEIMEILLYYAIPQRNTNDLAKRLIHHFGSFSNVFDASLDSLNDMGLTEHQALLLKLIPEITRRYLADKRENTGTVLDPDEVSQFFTEMFIGLENRERMMLILFDKKGKMVYRGTVSEGDFDFVKMPTREIISLAVKYSASIAYIAHNHPSGIDTPSREDIMATRKLKETLKNIGVFLVDHFIYADGECCSLAELDLV